MKHTLLLLLSFVTLHLSAQDKISVNYCATDKLHNEKMATDAVYAKRMNDFNNGVYSNRVRRNAQATTTHIIPVVVHVMHKGEALGTDTNITDEQIKAQIKNINENFRKIADTNGDDGADMEIEFALAVRDPDGNCTNGITRTDMTAITTYMNNGVKYDAAGSGITDGALKALDFWDSSQYYNIWIVSEFDNGTSPFAGYAYYASAHGLAYDGAVLLAQYFIDGANNTATHELGHAFNLYHTFEGDNGGDSCPAVSNGCGTGSGDCCADTAPHIRFTDCNTDAVNECAPNNTDLSFKRNYMTYTTAFDCLNMFSNDQKERAMSALLDIRGSLLAENGNMGLVPATTFAPDINVSGSVVCAGATVRLTDASSCIPNTFLDETSWNNISFAWTVTNGTTTYNYTAQNANFTPQVAGSYDVSLAVTVNGLTAVAARAGAIVVTGGITAPTCMPDYGQTGNFALVVNNVQFNTINSATSAIYNDGYLDFTCSNSTTVVAGSSHELALSVRAGTSYTEDFRVYIDYNNDGYFFPNELIMQGTCPAGQRNIYTQNIDIPANAIQNTLLTMRVIGEAGTLSTAKVLCVIPFFVGDIEDYGVYITSALATDDVTGIKGLTLSPNPATTAFTLTAGNAIESVVMYNMLGQKVLQKTLNAAQSVIDVSALSAGTYMVQATAQGKTSVLKLIKN